MRTYKALTTKDVVITPFDASKGFNWSLNECTGSLNQIEIYYGENVPYIDNNKFTGQTTPINSTLVYRSIRQMYYTNYISSSMSKFSYPTMPSTPVENIEVRTLIPGVQNPIENYDRFVGGLNNPRYENYLQSTTTQSRYICTSSIKPDNDLTVISIPSLLFGENIVPQTFEFRYTGSTGIKFDVKDDGDGNLYHFQSGFDIPSGKLYCGNIFYSHGIITFTSGALKTEGNAISGIYGVGAPANFENKCIFYSSSYRIYENSYECTSAEDEFTYTQNPTALAPLNTLSTAPNALVDSIYNNNFVNGIPGVYTGITLFPVIGEGSGAVLTITITGTDGIGEITGIDVTSPGNNYKVDDRYIMVIAGHSGQVQLLLKQNALSIVTKNGDVYSDFATGSYFAPYITTVGLYDDDKELLAVGKLSTPTEISKFVDTTILVNFDM